MNPLILTWTVAIDHSWTRLFYPLIQPRMYDELMTFLHHMYSTSTFILRETDDHRYPLSFKLNIFHPVGPKSGTMLLFILSGDMQRVPGNVSNKSEH